MSIAVAPKPEAPEDEVVSDLIFAARMGDSTAFDDLLFRFRHRIAKITRDFFDVSADCEDFMQEAYYGFYQAVRDFQGEKGAFPTFADLCIRRKLISYLRGLQRKKHLVLNKALSLDAPPSSTASENVTLLDRVPSRGVDWAQTYCQREFLSVLTKKCSPLENNVLSRYAQGYSYLELSAQCGVNLKSVDNALQRIKQKARRVLEEHAHFAEHLSDVISVA